MKKISFIRPCTIIWLILLGLTGVTWYISQQEKTGLGIVAFVLALTLFKSQMVADYFMGLKKVRLLWRGIVFGYLLVVCGLIGVAYYISL
ncbi:MAG: cytochrome C oxidase subunit IV family protein [Thiohalomonadaceae bacterium]